MRRSVLLLALVLAAGNAFAGRGHLVIINGDQPGVGFNDPAPATPIGGNPGTTLGAQRLNVFRAAAEQWDKLLDTDVDIQVSASFIAIPGCTATEGVLGQAAPMFWRHDFPGAPKANVWYPIALANKLAGTDLEPAGADIFIQFNTSDDNNTCLGDSDWYYGFDANHGDDVDLYVVVLHELGHGLGISNPTGDSEFKENRPSIFDVHTLDLTLGLRWDQMTAVQRRVSEINTGNLVWDGDYVRNAVARFLDPAVFLRVTPLSRDFDIGVASFGPSTNDTQLSGRIVAAVDEANEAGPTTLDGCTAFTNSAEVAGAIALVNRGTCRFTEKARNAQAAGAIGLIVEDNATDTCLAPGLGGDDAEVTIPAVSVTKNDGELLRAQGQANGSLQSDPTQRWGTSREGYMRLFTPCAVQPGSSTHHWDTEASPNLLMEPDVNTDLMHDVDLALYQLLDIGWTTRPGRTILKRK